MKRYVGILAVVAMLIGSASAGITGVYVDADASNTAAKDGTTPWYVTGGGGAAWDLRTYAGTENGNVLEGFWRDYDLVTTLSGLTAGQQYEVRFIYYDHTTQTWSGGLSFDENQDLVGVPAAVSSNSVATGKTIGVGPQYEYLVGTTAADVNGEIKVYLGARGDRTWYDGLSYVEVPEPTTMAMLGLAGVFSMVRRRK